ncbi:MAG: hypothetical protein COT24_04665, partial [Candidatus Kerfeldbacteria bacterium CG08_land_8_20_14_0_20_40_16]
SSDSTYIRATGADNPTTRVGLQNPTFGSGDTINSVNYVIRCRADTGNSAAPEKLDVYGKLGASDTVVLNAVAISRSTSFSDYASGAKTTDPAGNPWTYTNLQSLEMGIAEDTMGATEGIDCAEMWIVVDYTPAVPTLDQNHYWWRDDTTALNTAGGFLGSQDNSYTSFVKQTTYRLRVEIANTGSGVATGYQYRLQYAAKGAGCAAASYTDVPVTAATEHFEMVATDGYINGDNVTVSRLTATGTWADGEAVEDPSNQTESHNLTNAYYTEHEYAIQATTNATTDGLYCFRLNNNGSITNFSYSLYPEATVIAPTPTLTQNHYWWRDDTTALNTAGGFLGSEDNSYTSFLKQTTYRLRAEIANTGTGVATGYQYRLQYAAKGAGCAGASYTDVPVTATTEHFETVATDGYINGDNVTVTRLTPTNTWADGEAVEDPSNQTESHNLTNAYYTEHEYAIQATTNATTDGLYCFRLNNNGSITNFSYSLYPEVTVIVPAGPWWNSSWMYRQKLTFTQDSGQSGALSNMPILVIRDSSDTRFWNHVRDDGYDVRFLDGNDSTELQFHFEEFNSTTDDMTAWVEVPEVAAYLTTDFIYLYYGNSSASTDPQNAAGTYDTDSYFGAVWHMTEINAIDSTGNGNTGTQTGDPVVTGGKIGDGVDFTPTDYISVGVGATIDLSDKDVFTIELWAWHDSVAADKINFVQMQTANSWNVVLGIYDNDIAGNNYRFITRDDDGTARDTISGAVPPTGEWHYYVGTYNNGASDYKALYYDGTEAANTTTGINNLRPSAASTLIGTGETTPFGPFDGKMDEVRMSNTPRSAQWVKAQYLSMTNAFISYDTEQGYGLNHYHFRWRDNNYGLNVNNGWLAVEDTIYSDLSANTTIRLRVEIPDTGVTATNYQYRINYAARTGTTCGDESFTAVPVTATTEHFEMVDSLYTNDDDITSGFLTAPTTGTWTWANGKGVEDPSNQTSNFSLTNAYYTEFEYAIQATTNSLAGTTYCFQLSNAGSGTNFSYGILPQVKIVSPTFNQNYYRFYVDNDLVQPSDPWPAGGSDLLQNTPITTSDSPPDDDGLVRIRMSVQVTGVALPASGKQFRLEYVERSDGVCASATGWAAVGAAGSGTIWRGESDSTPADGSTVTGFLLDPSDAYESYEEQNDSVSNPNSIAVNNDGEWDWLIQNNGAVHDTLYCFRMAESDGTVFTTYTNYPKISTELTTFNSAFEAGNGETFTKPYTSDATKVSFNSELDGVGPLGPCTDNRKQNWFYFSMNNALNQSLQFTLINATASSNENTDWVDHKPVYSYDQVTWYRIASYGSASDVNWVYTFPGGGAKFTSDTVYIAHGIPYTYTNSENDITTWSASQYVTVTDIGNSVQSRMMHLVTIQDTNSPVAAANKKVYWFIARQHPMEPMGSYGIKGVIDFLIGTTDEAKLMRRSSIFKIIPMMNPDGAYLGHTTANAEYCNENREWTDVAPESWPTFLTDPTIETNEVYNAHYAIHDWMINGTPADAEVITDFHTRCTPPGIYHSNATWYDTDNNENPFEVLWKILDGNDHDDEFSLGVATGNSVEMFDQYHTATWGNDLEALNVEGTTYDFVDNAQATPENAAAFGVSYLKTIWALKEASSTVFLLTQTDPSGTTTPPQYTVVGSPGEYFIVLNDNTGGGIYNWYDRENNPLLTNDLGDATNNVDLLSWNDGVAARTLYGSSNTTLTVDSNSGIRTKFTYTGTLANQTNYNYTLERVIWQDGRTWSKFNFTNNTGGSINWAAMIQGANIDSGDAANSSPLYDNTADPPTQGTDNWFAQMGNGSTLKSSVVGHYVGQTGGWVYDDYATASDTDGERAYYSDTDGPIQTTGTSIAVNMCYQIRPDTDVMANEAAIDVYRNDIANPDSPTMITGTFTEFDKSEGGLEFAASSNNVKFTYTNATTYTKKKPVYVVTNYLASTSPILKVNDAYLDGETGTPHTTDTHIGTSYTSYVDTTNDIAYVQYLNDISTNINVEIKDTFAGISIAGIAYTDDDELTYVTDATSICVAVNAVFSDNCGTTTSGAFTISSVNASSGGEQLTLFIDGGSLFGNTVTIGDGSNIVSGDNLRVYQNHVVLRHEQTDISIADMINYVNDNNPTDILFTATDGIPDTLSIESSYELFIQSGYTFAPVGNVTQVHDIEIDGTWTAAATETVELDGTYKLDTGGTLNPSTSTITFDATAGTEDLITAGTGSLWNLTLNDGGGGAGLTIQVQDPLDVDNNVTITNGTLDVVSGENNQITVGGNWSNSDIFTKQGGTVLFDATDGDNTIEAGSSSFNGVTFSGASGGNGTWTVQTNDAAVSGTINVNTGDTLSIASGRTLTWTGSGFTLDGTISGLGRLTIDSATAIPTGGTLSSVVRFDATNGNTTNVINRTYGGAVEVYNSSSSNRTLILGTAGSQTIDFDSTLNLEATGAGTLDLTGLNWDPAVDLESDLTFTAGGAAKTIVSGAGNWNVAGSVNFTNGVYTATSGNTFQMNGSSKTITSASHTFQDFSVTGGSVSTVDAFAAAGNFTIGAGATLAQGANVNITLTGDTILITDTGTFTKSSGSGILIMDGVSQTFEDANTDTKEDMGNVQIGQSPGTTKLKSDFSATSLTILTGDTFETHGWDVTLTDYLDCQGTCTLTLTDTPPNNAGNGTIIDVGGNWTMSGSGTFTPSTDSKLFFNSTSGADTNRTIATGDKTFYEVEFKNAGGTNDNMVISGALNIDGPMTLTDGELVLNSGNPNINTAKGVTIASAGTVTKGTGTWTFDGTTAATYIDSSSGGPQNIGVVVFNKTSGVGNQDKVTLASSMTVDTADIQTGNTLNLASGPYTFTLANAGSTATVLTVTGTLTPGTSTVKYTATNDSGNINVITTTYDSLEFAPATAETYDLTNHLTSTNGLTGSITIGANATLDVTATNYGIDLAGNWTNNGNFTDQSGTVTLDGASQQTLSGQMTGTSDRFYNLTITNASAANPDVIFSSSADSANNFTAATASTQLQFLAGGTYTFQNISFNGQAPSTRVELRSSSTPTDWYLNVAGTRSVYSTDAKDSDACGQAPNIDASDITNWNSSGNHCWDFDAITFTISSNTISLGTLSTGSVSTTTHTIRTDTSALSGYTSMVYDDGNLRVGANDIDDASGGTIVAGIEEYGMATSDASQTITQDTDCATAPYNATALTTTQQTVAGATSGPVDETSTICYAASIDGFTAAGTYTQTVIFVTTGLF